MPVSIKTPIIRLDPRNHCLKNRRYHSITRDVRRKREKQRRKEVTTSVGIEND